MQQIESHPNNRYQKIKRIGEGTYGSVSQCYDHKSKAIVAIKKIKFIAEDQGVPINALREITMLKTLDHENITKLNDIHYNWKDARMFINLQYLPQNLYQHYKKNLPLSPYAIKSFMHQLLSAIYYMHSKMIMHRDLKPQNIMVSENGKLKICDFGHARIFSLKQRQNLTNSIATLWYRAPQIMLGCKNYDAGVDLWAIGCIFAEMALGHPIFEAQCQIGQLFKIFQALGTPRKQDSPFLFNCEHMSPTFPKFQKKSLNITELCQQGNDLLNKILQIDPQKRITIGKALKHNYFQGFS